MGGLRDGVEVIVLFDSRFEMPTQLKLMSLCYIRVYVCIAVCMPHRLREIMMDGNERRERRGRE